MTRLPRQTALVFPILWLAGCGVPEDPTFGVASEPLVTGNGQMQNGQMQNGQMQNGQMQNGAALQLIGADLAYTYSLINPPAADENPDVSDANLVLVPNVHLDKSMLTDGVKSGVAFRGHVIRGQ